MTNGEKYNTPEERSEAYGKFCTDHECKDCPLGKMRVSDACQFAWLTLEAEDEKPMDCPFCGSKCEVIGAVNHRVKCTECNYESIMNSDREKIIAAHNRVCKAVKNAVTPELYQALMEAVEDKCHFCTASEDERRELCDQCIVADWRDALAEATGEEVRDGK